MKINKTFWLDVHKGNIESVCWPAIPGLKDFAETQEILESLGMLPADIIYLDLEIDSEPDSNGNPFNFSVLKLYGDFGVESIDYSDEVRYKFENWFDQELFETVKLELN